MVAYGKNYISQSPLPESRLSEAVLSKTDTQLTLIRFPLVGDSADRR